MILLASPRYGCEVIFRLTTLKLEAKVLQFQDPTKVTLTATQSSLPLAC